MHQDIVCGLIKNGLHTAWVKFCTIKTIISEKSHNINNGYQWWLLSPKINDKQDILSSKGSLIQHGQNMRLKSKNGAYSIQK